MTPSFRPLITYVELAMEAEQAYQRADYERQRVERMIAQMSAMPDGLPAAGRSKHPVGSFLLITAVLHE